MAGEYPCDNVNLLSLVTPLELQADTSEDKSISDLWGWTDSLTNKEYAIVGMINGTSFVDVSDPLNPVVLGSLLAHTDIGLANKTAHVEENSLWKDIKTYNDHAFIVSEASQFGMQVFDLKRLRNVTSPPEQFTDDAYYDQISTAHNIVINPTNAVAYVTGALGDDSLPCQGGGLHLVSISDPINPTYLGCFDEDG